MKIDQRMEDDVCICSLQGRMDGTGAPAIEAQAQALFAAGTKQLVLDLSGVEYISSAGLRCVLVIAKKAGAISGKVVLCSLSPMVADVMKISGFHQLLTICDNCAEAIKVASGQA